MKAFFVRSLVIASLFFLGGFLAALTDKSFSALPVYFVAVTVWTLHLGFRKALWVVIPFLLLTDVLWDGVIGGVFLGGFLLATATTYLAVRIETRSQSLQVLVYSTLVGCFSALVVWIAVTAPSFTLTFPTSILIGKTFVLQLFIAILFFIPLSYWIQKTEAWLDTSYQEASKKIR